MPLDFLLMIVDFRMLMDVGLPFRHFNNQQSKIANHQSKGVAILSPTRVVDMATPGVDGQPSSLRNELELVTEAELARLLKVCRRQLYSWRMAGLIPYFKIGKAVRFRAAEVLAALEGMRGG